MLLLLTICGILLTLRVRHYIILTQVCNKLLFSLICYFQANFVHSEPPNFAEKYGFNFPVVYNGSSRYYVKFHLIIRSFLLMIYLQWIRIIQNRMEKCRFQRKHFHVIAAVRAFLVIQMIVHASTNVCFHLRKLFIWNASNRMWNGVTNLYLFLAMDTWNWVLPAPTIHFIGKMRDSALKMSTAFVKFLFKLLLYFMYFNKSELQLHLFWIK